MCPFWHQIQTGSEGGGGCITTSPHSPRSPHCSSSSPRVQLFPFRPLRSHRAAFFAFVLSPIPTHRSKRAPFIACALTVLLVRVARCERCSRARPRPSSSGLPTLLRRTAHSGRRSFCHSRTFAAVERHRRRAAFAFIFTSSSSPPTSLASRAESAAAERGMRFRSSPWRSSRRVASHPPTQVHGGFCFRVRRTVSRCVALRSFVVAHDARRRTAHSGRRHFLVASVVVALAHAARYERCGWAGVESLHKMCGVSLGPDAPFQAGASVAVPRRVRCRAPCRAHYPKVPYRATHRSQRAPWSSPHTSCASRCKRRSLSSCRVRRPRRVL